MPHHERQADAQCAERLVLARQRDGEDEVERADELHHDGRGVDAVAAAIGVDAAGKLVEVGDAERAGRECGAKQRSGLGRVAQLAQVVAKMPCLDVRCRVQRSLARGLPEVW